MDNSNSARSRKVIVITGCSSGFGKLAAETLAARGDTVFATMRDTETRNRPAKEDLERRAASAAGKLRVLDMDVTQDRSVDTAIGAIVREAGHIDVLVNNAGVMHIGVTEAFTMAEIQSQFETNFFGPARVARAVLPSMRERRSGLMIHVSSVAGRFVLPCFGVYCASKYALEALAESYRYELAGFGIDSVLVEPGPYSTGLLPRSPEPGDARRAAAYGEVSQLSETLKGGFRQLFDSPQPPRNDDVVRAIQDLVDHPGKRPQRTVVMPNGMDFGVARINDSVGRIQNEIMTAFGLDKLI